jgi:hypothetical protein
VSHGVSHCGVQGTAALNFFVLSTSMMNEGSQALRSARAEAFAVRDDHFRAGVGEDPLAIIYR